MENGPTKMYIPAKPLENSYMMPKVEDLGYQVSLLMNYFNEMGGIILKNVELAHLQELLKCETNQKIENLQKIVN